MNKDLLKEVKKKQEKRNIITETDYQLKMSDFILKIYNVCTPSKYGAVFPGKIQQDVGHYLKSVSMKLNRGDLHIHYKKFFEVKISYLNQKDKYSITNIRDWQDLDYFILCFVNGKFKPSFYCVPKKVVTDNPKITLTGMNNSKEVNSYNTYVGKRTSIDSVDIDWLFKKQNVLKGTSYTHLLSFIKTFKNKN
jgi:hypothetical protein